MDSELESARRVVETAARDSYDRLLSYASWQGLWKLAAARSRARSAG